MEKEHISLAEINGAFIQILFYKIQDSFFEENYSKEQHFEAIVLLQMFLHSLYDKHFSSKVSDELMNDLHPRLEFFLIRNNICLPVKYKEFVEIRENSYTSEIFEVEQNEQKIFYNALNNIYSNPLSIETHPVNFNLTQTIPMHIRLGYAIKTFLDYSESLLDAIKEKHHIEGTPKYSSDYSNEISIRNILIPYRQNFKWGFSNAQKEIIIPCEFDQVHCSFYDNLAGVCKDNLWGFINSTGDYVVQPQYESVTRFVNGVALVMKQKKLGMINTDGKVLTPFIFDSFKDIEKNLSREYIWLKIDNKWGAMDKFGNIKEAFIYEHFNFERNDYGYVTKESKSGLVDNVGRIIVPCNYRAIWIASEGVIAVDLFEKTGFYKIGEGEIIAPQYDKCDGVFMKYYDGIANVSLNDKWGAVNIKNEIVIPFKYEMCTDFKYGYAVVISKNRFGLINTKGDEVVPAIFNRLKKSEGVIISKVGKLYGLIDYSGNIILENTYDNISPFNNNVAIVEKDCQFGLIDKKGNEIIPCEYTSISFYSHESLLLNSGFGRSEYSIFNINTNEFNKIYYSSVFENYNLDDEFRLVYDLNKYGCINKFGDEIIPCDYDSLEICHNGLFKVKLDGKEGYIDFNENRYWD